MPIDPDFPRNSQVIGKIKHSDGEHFHYFWGPGAIKEAAENEEVKAAYEHRGEAIEPIGVSGTMVAVDWDSCVADGACIEACPVQVFQWYRTEHDVPAKEAVNQTFSGTGRLVGSIGRKLSGLAGLFSGFAKVFQPVAKIPAPSKDVIKSEMDFLDRLDDLADIIKDNETTSIRLVANPDTFSIENAKRALMSASLYGINVDMAVINKIMAGSSDEYYAKWASYQKGKVEDAKTNFYPLPIKEVRLYNTELRGIEMLRRHGEVLFGSDDPSRIFYRGKPYRFASENNTINMTVQVPFTEKDDFSIERYGDQLTLSVKTAAGHIVNIVPLPIATAGMKLARAKLMNHELNVLFEKVSA